MANPKLDALVKSITDGTKPPSAVFVVGGDLVVAEPQATRLAETLAKRAGCLVQTHRRPAGLGPILNDLRTYSLFDSAKVALVVDSALLADRAAAADLVDEAAKVLPVDPTADLDGARRLGASRLLQALHVFGLEPVGDAAELVATLPDWALQGGKKVRKQKPRGRSAKDRRELAEGLTALLEAARNAGLQGFAQGDLAELGALVQQGLPEGHSLVLVESSLAKDHPLVQTLVERGVVVDLGSVGFDQRQGWQGLAPLVEELASETGVGIDSAALDELARRTLRQTGNFKDRKVEAESTARLAGEYRKLAGLAEGGKIHRALVAANVDDRGEEDVWKIFDALGEGRGDEALNRFQRLVGTADDAMAARLSFFALLAGFCRQLNAVVGMARSAGVPAGVRSYQQFKSQWAPRLQGEPPAGGKNPLTGLHPFRLHRAYLAASRMDRDLVAHLPWTLLETEIRIKGGSSESDVAIAQLLAYLATAVRSGPTRRR